MLYLTAAAPLLYLVPGGPDPEGRRMVVQAGIYGPFAALAAVELWHRHTAPAVAPWIKAKA